MVSIRVQPLHSMASSQSHDHICQKAFSLSLFCVWTFQSIKEKKWAWSHLEVTYVPLVTRLHAVIKTMWRMQIQLLCVSVLYSMGSRVKPCPNMGIVTSHKSHGWNARFWLVERKFAALWLVRTQRGQYHYYYMLNLTHQARTLNSLIGGKSLSKFSKWRTYCFTNMQKKVPTARNWPLPTNRRRTSQQNGLTESQSNN